MSNPIVLMYHGIISEGVTVPGRETGAEIYDVSIENFKNQMACIQERGFSVATLNSDSISANSNVILTFDDGEQNNIRNAFPILRQRKFPAYFFVTVNRIGKKGYMNWEELKELRDADMIIGSHGLNHEILTGLKDKRVEIELAESKEILERTLKINIDYFSVPRGFYDSRIIDIAKKVGYKNIFTSDTQTIGDFYCVGRIAIKGNWSLERFGQALAGQIPLEEKLGDVTKSVAKNIFGNAAYDKLRNTILKGLRKPLP